MKKTIITIASSILILASIGILLSAMGNSKERGHAVNLRASYRNWKTEGRPQGEAFKKAIEANLLSSNLCISNIMINIDGKIVKSELAQSMGDTTYFVTGDETVLRINSSGKVKVIDIP